MAEDRKDVEVPNLWRNKLDDLFGGQKKWVSEQWTASDDRVRGGRSQSYLTISDDQDRAKFHGNLDITALGGAGFASQRTTSAAGGPWDLSNSSGLCIGVENADDRAYTLVVKDEILPKRPDGREQSTVSYEFSFSIVNQDHERKPEASNLPNSDLPTGPCVLDIPAQDSTVSSTNKTLPILIFIPWSYLLPFYRGKRKSDAEPLKLSSVKRLSIMCRSLFGQQYGAFSIGISFISTLKLDSKIFEFAVTRPIQTQENGNEDSKDDPYFVHKIQAVSGSTVCIPRQTEEEEGWDLIEDLSELQLQHASAQQDEA